MAEEPSGMVTCQICGQQKCPADVLPAEMVRPALVAAIMPRYPQWSGTGYICLEDLNRLRTEYVEHLLEHDKGDLSVLRQEVVKSLKESELISQNLNLVYQEKLTLGDRVADRVTEFGGSWGFILSYLFLTAVWVIINVTNLLAQPFDPYPFIFLNLILSGLAGIQAPIILMSQNRQDAKDRFRDELEYRLNLKAELEIRHLNEKMDMLLSNQWQRLLEIQRVQMEIMEEHATAYRREAPECKD